MSSDGTLQDTGKPDVEEPQPPPTEPAAMANRKRPRLDLSTATGGRERKRGKSMFGLLVGTLNKAKIEDKERNASEAAKKRQLIEQRLQNKLRKETDSVRRAEEAKKDKTISNRKEEELQLKDSIYKFRRTRLPLFSNFLITSDIITSDESTPPPPGPALSVPPRGHPPPLYYLPVILLPSQEAFLTRRKAQVLEAAEKEWQTFREERANGIKEVNELRQRVADEEERRKTEKSLEKDEMDTDSAPIPPPTSGDGAASDSAAGVTTEPTREVEMDVDDNTGGTRDGHKEPAPESDKKDDAAPMQADDDDAVEY